MPINRPKECITFTIPCYRSENTVGIVIDEIKEKMKEKPEYTYEIIAVNDASPDNVLKALKNLASQDNHVKIIDLAQNKGKHAALMAGFAYAKGDIIVCVDDDNQCPLDCLWDLIAPLYNDSDISIAKYTEKKQSMFKNMGSLVNGIMARSLINKPKDLSLNNFIACKRFVIEEIIKYTNDFPYIDGLFLRTTSHITNVEMEERKREIGTSNYTFKKSFSLWLNGFTAFSVKPLRIATIGGSIFAFVGFVFAIYVIINKILNPIISAGYSSTIAVILFIGGIIMVMLGLIGEYIGRSYISINKSPQYVIRERINLDSNEEHHAE